MRKAPKTVSDVLFASLREAGAEAVFGIPGDFALPLFEALSRADSLPLHTLAHEPAVAFAADAAARYRGGLGVALFTFGAGTLNAVNAIASAYAEQVPLVVISGAPSRAERDRGLLVHHQVRDCDSQRRILAELTVKAQVIEDPEHAPRQIAEALRACRTESRPVYIEVPRDVALLPCGAAVLLPERAPAPHLLDGAVGLLEARIRRARRGLFLVDAGARRFGVEADVREMARALGWPVVTTFMGRGVLDGTPGLWFGAASDAASAALFEEAELIIGVGVVHSDTNHAGHPPLMGDPRLVDLTHRAITVAPGCRLDLPLGAVLRELRARVCADGPAEPPPTWGPSRASGPPRGLSADAVPVHPDDVARAINDAFSRLPAPLPVVADVGDSLFTAGDIACRDLLAPGFYATMGYAIPAGIGLQAVSGQRPLILVGDGAFQMTGLELARCATAGWDPIVVLLDNARWQMVASFDPAGAPHPVPPIDYAALADALGGCGHRVTDRASLATSLGRALDGPGRLHLLHVKLPEGAVSGAMRRFVDVFRRGRDRQGDGERSQSTGDLHRMSLKAVPLGRRSKVSNQISPSKR